MAHAGTALIDPHKVFEKIKLAEGMKVADFGCGRTGHFVFPAAQLVGEQGVVYAVDIVKNILQSIRSMAKSEGYDNVHTVWSDIELPGKTPIPEKGLDACFFVNVLFQLKEKAVAVAEAGRLLKENGFLVIIEWSKKLGPLGPGLHQAVTAEDIIGWGQAVGLELAEKCAINDYHYLVIMQKKEG